MILGLAACRPRVVTWSHDTASRGLRAGVRSERPAEEGPRTREPRSERPSARIGDSACHRQQLRTGNRPATAGGGDGLGNEDWGITALDPDRQGPPPGRGSRWGPRCAPGGTRTPNLLVRILRAPSGGGGMSARFLYTTTPRSETAML